MDHKYLLNFCPHLQKKHPYHKFLTPYSPTHFSMSEKELFKKCRYQKMRGLEIHANNLNGVEAILNPNGVDADQHL